MMDPAVIIILLLYKIDSAQAVRNSEPLVISAEPGEAVTLNCTFVDNSNKDVRMWYKQRLEHAPLEVGSQLEGKLAVISDQFDKSRFKLNRIANGISLSIERVTKEDEGMYFCGETGKKTLDFSTATFLAVTGQLNTLVLQTPVRGSVSPGESVTLQCTVLSEIRSAELRVLWFRAAAGQSFPEIIYTHQNSSSRQCEINSSTHSSVYNFSKNILNQHHTGTYYCAVAACGKIIFGNGTTVEMKKVQEGAVSVRTTRQEQNTENLHYTAKHNKEKKAKAGRVKREKPNDTVYSQVGSSKAAAQRSHR
ncbi:uncharacterized protein LOC118806533 [Colossoma macropomum]|uniref:uncharacterized protein LOC118806533 n=1 Tax=Colossoma macropomum TaxID=42526 RepID=UPI0018655115|nr:uncharacterized protein LOC118806533 [Colossoma macropomum]